MTPEEERDDANETRRAMREAFVNDLYRLMDQKGIGQRRLADRLDLAGHTTISRWRHLAGEPPAELVFRIEKALGVDPGTLSRHLGYLPLDAAPPPKITLPEMIEADPILPPWGKEILLTAYREIMRSLGKGRRRS